MKPSGQNSSAWVRAFAGGLTLLAWLALVGAVVSPLVINPRAYYDAYFVPKWSWLASMAALGVAALLARAALGSPAKLPLSPILYIAAVYFLWNGASILWSRSPSLAAERALQIASLTALLWVAVNLIRGRRSLLGLGWLWLAVAALSALWTLRQDFARAFRPDDVNIISNLSDWRGYLSAGLGNTNHIGDLMALAILPAMLMLGEARRRPARMILLLFLLLYAAALTVCWSVGSNLGLFAGALFMLVAVLLREGLRMFVRRPARWAALAALWGLMLAFFAFDHAANPHAPGLMKQAFGSERWKEGGPTRLAIWAGGLEIVRTKPLLGAGAGNFTYVYPEMKSALIGDRADLLVYQGAWTNAAHNILLQAWSELGAVGFFILIALAAAALHSLLAGLLAAPRSEFLMRAGLAAMFLAALAQGMMNFTLEQPSGAVAFYLLLAACVAERASRRSSGMPALVVEQGSLRLYVELESMKKPSLLGFSFRLAPAAASVFACVILAVAFGLLPFLYRPVAAETLYAQAVRARRAGVAMDEEKFLRAALEVDPNATGCRSRYSEFLVEQRRGEEALAQLKIVRERLNSPELWERESRALALLGRKDEAAAAMATYRSRLWRAGQAP